MRLLYEEKMIMWSYRHKKRRIAPSRRYRPSPDANVFNPIGRAPGFIVEFLCRGGPKSFSCGVYFIFRDVKCTSLAVKRTSLAVKYTSLAVKHKKDPGLGSFPSGSCNFSISGLQVLSSGFASFSA